MQPKEAFSRTQVKTALHRVVVTLYSTYKLSHQEMCVKAVALNSISSFTLKDWLASRVLLSVSHI